MTSTEILNPIRGRRSLPVFAGYTHHPVDGHSAMVYLAAEALGRPIVQPPSLKERWRQRYWQYEIDTARHWTALSLALPAEEEAFLFKVWVSLTWQVVDPVEVARVGLDDARPIIWGLLDQQLRLISRRYGIEKSGEAEEEMAHLLDMKLGDIGYGLRLGFVSVNVRLDEAAERYIATRVESRRARLLAGDDHDLETLHRQYTDKIAQMKGATERAEMEHTAEIQRMRDEQEKKAAAIELEHKRQRLSFYEGALHNGGHSLVLLHLIEHPHDVQPVLKMLEDGQREVYDRTRAVLQSMFDNNMMNAADAEPMVEIVLEQLRSFFNMRPQSMTVSREKTSEVLTAKKETDTTRIDVT
ncbi:hypothetical protein [Actinoplanes solisilvae]|uniref:hypothetical protein n=1 Tax=Actinoplanes solisilvae TaxID=2486853 RepID=UPI000FDBF0FB|nr:hypothetical protein [Actinoplanes solisilvae]